MRGNGSVIGKVVGVFLGVTIGFAGWVVVERLGAMEIGSEVSDSGTARVLACDGGGLFGSVCELDVMWDGGRAQRVSAEPGQFGDADTGDQVLVAERQVITGKGTKAARVFRADFEPPSLLLTVAILLGAILVGAYVAGLAFIRRRR